MSEIYCLVILNNNACEFLMNLDSQVTFETFNKEVQKAFNLNDTEVKFSYLDNEDDKISFSSEIEFKEFLDFASTNEITTIFAQTPAQVAPSPSMPEAIHPSDAQKVEEKEESENGPQTPLEGTQNNNNNCKKEERDQSSTPLQVICDHCEEEIKEVRYKCLQCFNYDLCAKCEELKAKSEGDQIIHPESHIFAKMYAPFLRSIHHPFMFPNFPHRFFPRNHRHVYSTLMNNASPLHHNHHQNSINNNNNNNNSDDHPSHPMRPDSWQRNHWKPWCARKQRITQLENRVQSLESEITQIKSLLLSKPSQH